MLIIKDTIKSMNATLDDADKYVHLALRYKDEYPELANVYYDTTKEHLDTYDGLHKQIVKQITKYREQNGEPPANMLAVYNWEHDKEIDYVEDIKRMLGDY